MPIEILEMSASHTKTEFGAVFVGEAMVELAVETGQADHLRFAVAGDTLNTAVYFKRVLKDSIVNYATVLGRDPFSDKISDFMVSEGIGTATIRRTPNRNCGLYGIETSDTGERSFTYWRESSAARLLFKDDSDFEVLKQHDLICFSGITLAILSPASRERFFDWLGGFRAQAGSNVAFDSNYRPRLWEDVETARYWTARAMSEADIILPSVDDEMALFGDADVDEVLERLQSYGSKQGALKCGESGSISLADTSIRAEVISGVNVVDTTAAGDSFNAGFLAAFVSGREPVECLGVGQQLAATVIQHRGAIIPKSAHS